MINLPAGVVESIAVGFAAGVTARLILLRIDHRQYPTLPHNTISHLAFGVIAAAVGAVALPALMAGEFTAVTFLVLAATQFREVRSMERSTLTALDSNLLAPRGADYIEGIASVFESRNYLVMLVGLLVSSTIMLTGSIPAGSLIAVLTLVAAYRLRSGGTISEVAAITEVPLRFDGASLYIDTIFIMNVGTDAERKEVNRYGLGLLITPQQDTVRDKLAQPGQRKAILHEIITALGTRQDLSVPELTPMARKDQETGRLAFYLAPFIRDGDLAIRAGGSAPLLESSRASRKPARK
ncbi:MAG: YIEGIA domain-containing protein [Thermaerobacterales bacterium]